MVDDERRRTGGVGDRHSRAGHGVGLGVAFQVAGRLDPEAVESLAPDRAVETDGRRVGAASGVVDRWTVTGRTAGNR